MKPKLFALVIVLFPLLSYAQNGSVSFGTSTSAAPDPSTKTTSTSMGFENDRQQPAPCKSQMDANSFKAAKETVANASYEDKKLAAAKNMLEGNCVSTDQVIQVCKLFGFEQSKLDFAKFAYSKTTDRKNYSKVTAILSLEASKKQLNSFISNGGK